MCAGSSVSVNLGMDVCMAMGESNIKLEVEGLAYFGPLMTLANKRS